ncbi:adenosylcobalamin-dependent ribonucleoside-diphosphate reductase, partial [Candidatus Woesearchaeota archaeon]
MVGSEERNAESKETAVLENIRKRNGAVVRYDRSKIEEAIFKAAQSVGGSDRKEAARLAEKAEANLLDAMKKGAVSDVPSVEEIQDVVEKTLIEEGHAKTAKAYIVYRAKRAEIREKEKEEQAELDYDEQINLMFEHKSKLLKVVPKERIETYKKLYHYLKELQKRGELPVHPSSYLGGNELATNIYERKYYLKNIAGQPVESKPEHVFTRLAAYMAAMEDDGEKQKEWAKKFYEMLYEGHFMPGGRVIAGAGDLYRLKTLANCFVTVIEKDNLESIYKAAYECARTYSYGGGIGTDISVLRPRDSVVHNAADKSTGSVSFMELYSLTTGLIGQSGRRGALMLTIDVKHPDVMDFIRVKKVPNWVTKQIVEQCKWSGRFDEEDLKEIEKQVRENTQVRFANISLKVSDEFMQAVEEQTKYGPGAYVAYLKKEKNGKPVSQGEGLNYSYGMPSRNISNYEFLGKFDSFDQLKEFLRQKGANIGFSEEDVLNVENRNMYGDFVVRTEDGTEIAVRQSGDFMHYFNSEQTGEIKKLVKARTVWDEFVAGNYTTAEPGLIFWSTMTRYSPSNYVGRPIASTNPCGEVPLEDGGACNLASVNLSRMVRNGFTKDAEVDWELLRSTVRKIVRFLDNVMSWNSMLNPLEKQRKAAAETRRLGIGIMGMADMFLQLGIAYDSEDALKLIEKVGHEMANAAYQASAELAEEKGSMPVYDYEKYSKGPFFKEILTEETRRMIKEKGLRNVALLSIAPTGSISNIVLSFRNGNRNYIGVSGGIEPVFSLYYTRRSESFGNKFFKVFHSTVQAFIDMNNLSEKAEKTTNTEELRYVLPEYFFRTAHYIQPEMRVKIQGTMQKYIDHSISSTVNLPESISPEVISNIYIEAWKDGLKGITIYRDGSRYPILSIDQKQTEFQQFKKRKFRVTFDDGKELVLMGDEVFTLPSGKLSTPFHAIDAKEKGVTIEEVVDKPSNVVKEEKKPDRKDDSLDLTRIVMPDEEEEQSG